MWPDLTLYSSLFGPIPLESIPTLVSQVSASIYWQSLTILLLVKLLMVKVYTCAPGVY